ncbi:hypothetical protein C0995_003285 [Termitomyces sp. Mi166|nr:hypothetical protein C0995_003285 [Termitomyces sp. Mi166\
MTYAPTNPVDVPPYQLQHLFSTVGDASEDAQIRCAQAFGSEIYVGCSNGELIRFALQAEDPNKVSPPILSRQTVPNEKSVDEIILVPCLGRAFILSDRVLYFYTLPSLDPVSLNIVKPIRHVVTLAVDHRDLQRPPILPNTPSTALEPVNFCIIKRTGIAMYVMRERMSFLKEIPLPQGANLARRLGHHLCIADKEFYSMVDLEAASLFPVVAISQAPDSDILINPSITVVGENEFLILSWTGTGTIGLFLTAEGDPVRGTLEWPSHPVAVCLDYPYITTLLPNGTIEIHSIETQAIVQVIGADNSSDPTTPTGQQDQQQRSRINLVSSCSGYLVPSVQRSEKMRSTQVRLLRAQEPMSPT